MHHKRDSHTSQKQLQKIPSVSKKNGRVTQSTTSATKPVKTASSRPNPSNHAPKYKLDVQHKNCPHVNKKVSSPTNNSKRNTSPQSPSSKNKTGNAKVMYKRCEQYVQNLSGLFNNASTKNATSESFNSGIARNVIESNKKIEVGNTSMASSRPNSQKNSSVQQKDTVSETSKPNPPHANKSKAQPQTISNNVSQQKNVASVTQQNKNKDSKNVLQNNPAPRKQPTNPNTKKNNPSSKDDKITEIYKRSSRDSATKLNSEPSTSENLNFQTVTRELASIIKNFQKQIHDVPIGKAKMEEVPSAMIKPKIKEFFKNPQPAPLAIVANKNQTSSNICDKNSNNKNQNLDKKGSIHKNQIQSKNSREINSVPKKNSLKKLSKTSVSSRQSKHSDVRRFHSLTQHNLSMTGSTSSRRISSSLGIDPLKLLKEEVQRAIREHKTFTVRGHYSPIRKALLARGWVEKFHASYKDQLNDDVRKYQNYSISELLPLLRRENLTSTCKNLIKSKLLGGYQVDFYWGRSDEAFRENPDKIKLTMINKLKREIFSYTNKQGLCEASKMSYWYQKNNVSKLNHPRSYSLGKNGDVKGFTEDFNITAAMSLLKWVVKMSSTKECKVLSPCGKIPIETFDFALNECCKFIKKGKHEDIDMQILEATENEWKQFLDYFYKLIHYNNHFKTEGQETEDSLIRKANYVINNLKTFYPYVDMDGMMNIWILKPTASSRGRGIHMCRTLQYVLKTVKDHIAVRYIVQKYIERPLLIYNTKFDIRQWFLISNCTPLTIWMYKDCYLRFSSQTYNLRKLHESIHLTNNSVQCKYKNTSIDTALPSYNMWDSTEFKRYLSNIGYPSSFVNIIYPGMKQCITAAVLMHQDKMVVRKKCFELYGADFILTEDFHPWLLEINSNPALYASTPITARMCPKVLEDVIKVVVDYAHNVKAETGGFEMIYKEQMIKLPLNANLEVKGMPLHSNYFFNSFDQEQASQKKSELIDQAQTSLKNFGEDIKKTLKNLLQIIQSEKQKRGAGHQNQNLAIVA